MSDQCEKCLRKNCRMKMKRTAKDCEPEKEQVESRWHGKDLEIRRRV